MEYTQVVPTSDERDYCNFCFGAANVHLVFPLVRPDLRSIIDNIIGISIAPEAYETFSLCDECITTMDMFVTFRNKCRLHYEKVREVKIMNQAVKRMFPVLRDEIKQTSPLGSLTANESNMSNYNNGTNPNESLVQNITMNTSTSGENDDCNGSARKRNYSQLTLDNDCDSSVKKARIQNETKHRTKFHHIREIMNRFRCNKLQINGESASSPISSRQNRIDFTNENVLLSDHTTKTLSITCKPCVVVLKNFQAN